MSYFSLFEQHHLYLTDEEKNQFLLLLKVFQEYNAHTNLSAIRDEQGIVEKHFIDSLMIAPLLSSYVPKLSGKILDIGSGGGFPGIPIKIVFPKFSLSLLDSVGKKVRAMQSFVEALQLEDIEVLHDRAEHLATLPEYCGKYNLVISRSTAYIDRILLWAKPFLAPGGKIILYKRPSEEEHRDQILATKKLNLRCEGEHAYTLAGTQRILVVFSQ